VKRDDPSEGFVEAEVDLLAVQVRLAQRNKWGTRGKNHPSAFGNCFGP
jgi:hypothetical protein